MRLRSGISTQEQAKELDESEKMGRKNASKKHRAENGLQKNNKNITESKPSPRNNANNSHNESETEESLNSQGQSVNNIAPTGNNVPNQVQHNHYVLLGLKISVFILVTMFFAVPIVIRLNPWILSEVTFMHRVSWPPFLDLSKPADIGLSGTTSFKLQVGKGVEIGAWHVLPKTLVEDGITHEKSLELLKSSYRPIVLYLHGNTGTRAGHHRMRLYKILQSADYHVIAIDYRGYGDSTGHPTEDGLCEDAYTAYTWLRQHSIGHVYIWGHSLGTGVATKLSKTLCELDQAPEGVILEAPFNNMKDAATNHPLSVIFKPMPWFTFAFLDTLAYNGIFFASDKSIASIIVPVLILHAKDDGIVPYELGYKLYQAALSSKQVGGVEMISFEASRGFGHKHIHKAPELPEIIRKFIREDKK